MSLILRSVHKNFAGQNILSGISLQVRQGESVAIVGRSGCGKSTLLRLIAGLDREFAGQILLQGRPVTGPSRDCGIIFQEHRLLPWLTVERNVGLALLHSGWSHAKKSERIAEQLELVGLTAHAKSWPHQISGGMSQRVAIARSLVNHPQLLLLDEPFSALDAFTRMQMQDELLRLWHQEPRTFILVTHDIEEAVYLCDRVIVLESNPGRIAADLRLDLPYPRRRDDRMLHYWKHRILQHLLPAVEKLEEKASI